MIRTVNPGSPLSPLAPLVPGPPWSKNQKQAVKTACLWNVHLQIQETCCNNKMQHQSAPCTTGIHLKNVSLTVTACQWYEQVMNWFGQCMEASAALYFTLSPWAKSFIPQYLHTTVLVWRSKSKADSHYMNVRRGKVHICESPVHLGYIMIQIWEKSSWFTSKNNFKNK